jgi:hypothetical protein
MVDIDDAVYIHIAIAMSIVNVDRTTLWYFSTLPIVDGVDVLTDTFSVLFN